MRRGLLGQSAFVGLCLMAGDSFAGLPDTEMPVINISPGTVGLGAAIRRGTSPYVGINNISSQRTGNKADLLPLYLYEGEWLFAHGTSAGG